MDNGLSAYINKSSNTTFFITFFTICHVSSCENVMFLVSLVCIKSKSYLYISWLHKIFMKLAAKGSSLQCVTATPSYRSARPPCLTSIPSSYQRQNKTLSIIENKASQVSLGSSLRIRKEAIVPCLLEKISVASSGTSSLFPRAQIHFRLFPQRASQTLTAFSTSSHCLSLSSEFGSSPTLPFL